MKYRAVVFDMDGTILNTLDDLRDSLNYAMAETGHRHDFTSEETGCFFGSGAAVAVARALCLEAGRPAETLESVGMAGDETFASMEQEVRRVLAVFQDWYPAHCEIKTCPYPGILPLLEELRGHGLKTAVVSNKLFAAVRELCETHFRGLFDAFQGEREPEVRRKPAPDMTLAALDQLGVSPAEAVYVGDSEIDLLTAKNAGLDCVAVTWGFRSRRFLEEHHAARIVERPAELREMLLQ